MSALSQEGHGPLKVPGCWLAMRQHDLYDRLLSGGRCMSDLNFQTAFDLSGKTVVITGAAGGIGREMARIFAERGLHLARVDRDPAVNDLADALGCDSHSFIADLQDESDIVRTVSAIAERFGGIDILINNAGIGIVGKAINFKTDDWDRTMAINLRAQFIFAREVAPHMRAAGWGRIVVISSQAAVVGIDEHVAYSASKAVCSAWCGAWPSSGDGTE